MNLKTIIRIISIFFISLSLAIGILYISPETRTKGLFGDTFLFAYFGLFLGLIVAVLSTLVPILDRILTKLLHLKQNGIISPEKYETLRHAIPAILQAFKRNASLVFSCFIINLIILILRTISWSPIVKVFSYSISTSILSVLYSLTETITVFLSLFAIYDLLSGLFRIIESLLLLISKEDDLDNVSNSNSSGEV